MLEKYEAERVLEDGGFRITGKILFQVQILDPGYRIFSVADFAEDLPGLIGVKGLEGVAPPQIPGTIHRVFLPRYLPPADVLTA